MIGHLSLFFLETIHSSAHFPIRLFIIFLMDLEERFLLRELGLLTILWVVIFPTILFGFFILCMAFFLCVVCLCSQIYQSVSV